MSNSEGYIAEMANIIGGFEDVIKCLHHEPEGSVEYSVSELAQESISQAKEVIIMVAALGVHYVD